MPENREQQIKRYAALYQGLTLTGIALFLCFFSTYPWLAFGGPIAGLVILIAAGVAYDWYRKLKEGYEDKKPNID